LSTKDSTCVGNSEFSIHELSRFIFNLVQEEVVGDVTNVNS
jgi:hypothetical protein